ncbi:MAG: hypothetical protein AAF125_16940, partial [Chloroflexota bacterium]
MSDQPERQNPEVNTPEDDEYDYLIDPMVGLPEIDLPDDEGDNAAGDQRELRVGRAPAPKPKREEAEATVIYRA